MDGQDVRMAAPLTVILFGATGDLAKRKLIPGLLHLFQSRLLDDMRVVGTSLDDMSVEDFRELALRAISRNMLRSFLTVLGIVIGVAAVIAMVTIGNGTTAQVSAELSKLGTNMLFVRPGQFGPGRVSSSAKNFTDRDVEAIRTQISGR